MTNFLKHLSRFAIFCSLPFSSVAGSPQEEQQSVAMLKEYIELLVTGNYESAAYLWTDEAQERSARFGIRYTNLAVKADASSPLTRFLPAMLGEPTPPTIISEQLSSEYYLIKWTQFVNGEVRRHNYYVKKADGWFRLTYPQDFYSAAWPVVETDFLRIHAHPSVAPFLNPAVLNEADKFVRRLADSLSIDKATLENIGERKIEYFYCDSDDTVRDIVGVLVKGTVDLASNDIISASFPHFHELSHLLINIRLKEIYLYTLPLFREGLAVHYGGRWGKQPATLTDLGAFIIRQGLVDIDSILTIDGFTESAGADIAYPVSGLFASFLIDNSGRDIYFNLYRSMSGDFGWLNTLPADSIRLRILRVTGLSDWNELKSRFNDFLRSGAVENGPAAAGELSGAETLLSINGCRVVASREWLGFEFKVDESGSAGSLLFGFDKRLENKRSKLFEEQFGAETKFGGQRFGVRFDRNEAGLYDYASNQLVAKYIVGISPSEGYLDDETGVIKFLIRTNLLGEVRPTSDDHRLLGR